MKRILLPLLLVTLYCSLSAQSLDYTFRVKNDAGKASKRAELFTARGKTDENGCFKMNAKFNRNIIIVAEGCNNRRTALKAEPTHRVMLSPTGAKNETKCPELLKTELEAPLYVVNGVYVKGFTPSNYTADMIAQVTATKKWNKITKSIFKGTEIDDIDVTNRGVLMVQTTDEIILNTPKNKMDYTILVTDTEGKPIKDAVVYARKGSADKTGTITFSAKAGAPAMIVAFGYNDYNLLLPEQSDMDVVLTKKVVTDGAKTSVKPRFQSGDFMQFKRWFTESTHDQLLQCSERGATHVKAEFVIGKSGKVITVNIVESTNPRAERVVKRTLYRSPQWTPAMQNGELKKFHYVLPVNIPSLS